MKKIGQLMNEMGFDKDAPETVKRAFLKHLIKSAAELESKEVHINQNNKEDRPLKHVKRPRKLDRVSPAQLSLFEQKNYKKAQ